MCGGDWYWINSNLVNSDKCDHSFGCRYDSCKCSITGYTCIGTDCVECSTDIDWWFDPIQKGIKERSGNGTEDGVKQNVWSSKKRSIKEITNEV